MGRTADTGLKSYQYRRRPADTVALASRQGESGRLGGLPGRSHGPLWPLALAAFALYWLSAAVLQSRGWGSLVLFGSDTWVYWQLAEENIAERIGTGERFWLDRAARFHPLTVAMAIGWMTALEPLAAWIDRITLLQAMFAAVGAVGVWAAMRAFAAAVPGRYVALCGAIYATSLGIWYFSSIEESKIVTTTLAALYIATYLHLRQNWTTRGAVLLTAILMAGCLNGIDAAFLVVIPAVDTLVRHRSDLRQNWRRIWQQGRWIGLHALPVPVVLAFLEVVVNGHWASAGGATPPERGIAAFAAEGASHAEMFWFYVTRNDFGLDKLHWFLVNWLLFSIAAPALHANTLLPLWPEDMYFASSLANYLASPVSAGLAALFIGTLVVSALPRYRPRHVQTGVLLPLGAYALLRGVFFFTINPEESLLYSSSTTLAHLLLIGIPFTASSLPAKRGLLAAFAAVLLIVNGSFIVGR